jgi:hypothetical protein
MDQCNGSGAVASCTISGSSVYVTLTNYGNGSTFIPTVSCTQQEVNYAGLVGGTLTNKLYSITNIGSIINGPHSP